MSISLERLKDQNNAQYQGSLLIYGLPCSIPQIYTPLFILRMNFVIPLYLFPALPSFDLLEHIFQKQ